MAALVNSKPLLREFFSSIKIINIAKQYSALPPKKTPPKKAPGPMIYHNKQKLESRGYLRPLKAYVPPVNVLEQFTEIIDKHGKGLSLESNLTDPQMTFKVLTACYETFNHSVPNSQLHTMRSVGDILEFYKTPVDDLTPIDHLQAKDLPPNLHIQLDAKRFDPDDPVFAGVSAFPQSHTIISDLKARKKYKPVEAQNWTKDWRELALGYIRW